MVRALAVSGLMMLTRVAKVLLTAGVGLYLALVVFNNVTDYWSNHAFVQHVLAMDTTFPDNAGRWRSLHARWMVHAFYLSIIVWEAVACTLIAMGSWRMWRARAAPPLAFARAKGLATAGLALNLLQWLIAFIAVGGEWFLMWQSSAWNGSDVAGRMFTIAGITLLFVNTPDEDTSPAAGVL
jgi:predicted small integral membrane protein